MKKNVVLEVICLLIIVLFVYTAVSKLINYENFKFVMHKTPVLRPFINVLAIALPVSELVAAGLLLLPALRKWGLYSAVVLMSAFTLYVAYILFFSPHHLPCVCGGIIKDMNWEQHLAFNVLFTLVVALGIWLNNTINDVDNSTSMNIKLV